MKKELLVQDSGGLISCLLVRYDEELHNAGLLGKGLCWQRQQGRQLCLSQITFKLPLVLFMFYLFINSSNCSSTQNCLPRASPAATWMWSLAPGSEWPYSVEQARTRWSLPTSAFLLWKMNISHVLSTSSAWVERHCRLLGCSYQWAIHILSSSHCVSEMSVSTANWADGSCSWLTALKLLSSLSLSEDWFYPHLVIFNFPNYNASIPLIS